MAKVYARNKNYTGVSASVNFINGVGETDNPYLLQWFRENGYTIEDGPVAPVSEAEQKLMKLSDDELKAIADKHGISLGNIKKRETIIKKLLEAGDNNDGQPEGEGNPEAQGKASE